MGSRERKNCLFTPVFSAAISRPQQCAGHHAEQEEEKGAASGRQSAPVFGLLSPSLHALCARVNVRKLSFSLEILALSLMILYLPTAHANLMFVDLFPLSLPHLRLSSGATHTYAIPRTPLPPVAFHRLLALPSLFRFFSARSIFEVPCAARPPEAVRVRRHRHSAG